MRACFRLYMCIRIYLEIKICKLPVKTSGLEWFLRRQQTRYDKDLCAAHVQRAVFFFAFIMFGYNKRVVYAN